MNYSEFLVEIKNDNLKPVYLFIGDEGYLMNKAIEKLKNKYIDPSLEALNYVIVDGKDAGFDNILNACETLPFMAEKKLVIVKDIAQIIDRDEMGIDKKLGSYVEGLDSYLSLILIDKSNEIKKTTKLYKTIKKLDGVVEYSKLKGSELNKWIENILKKYNKKLSTSNLSYFIQKSTYSEYGSTKTLYDLENELIKLINYTLEEEISRDNIDLVLTKTLDTNIFNLLSSINRKDSDSALKIFNEMHISNEPIPRIIFMIVRQLRLMLGYKVYREKGYTEGKIQEKIGVRSSFEFGRIAKESRSFTESQLKKSLEYILEIDVKQKTSSYDEKLALEILIINLAHSL